MTRHALTTLALAGLMILAALGGAAEPWQFRWTHHHASHSRHHARPATTITTEGTE